MTSSNASPSSGGNWVDANKGPTLDISDLSESGMRRLLIILKENHPNALRDAMSIMVNAEGARSSAPSGAGAVTKGNSGATTPTMRASLESSTASSSSSSSANKGVPAFVKAAAPKLVEEQASSAANSDKPSMELSEVDEEESSTAATTSPDKSSAASSRRDEEKKESEDDDDDAGGCAESRADEVGAIPLGKLGNFMAETAAAQPPLPVLDREEMSEITMDFTAAAVTGGFPPPAAVEEDAAPAAAPTGSGCYLVFDADGSKLLLHYSHVPVSNAIGFWTPGCGRKIQGFKFKGKHFGKYDLVNDCAGGVTGRKNYYSGWCQFVRAARALGGSVTLFRRSEEQRGLDVDVFVYFKEIGGQEVAQQQTVKLEPDVPVDVSDVAAVACCPRHTEFGEYATMNVDMTRWLTEASNIGAASSFAASQGTPPSSGGAFDRKRASSSFVSAPSTSFDEGTTTATTRGGGNPSTVQRAASMPLSPVVGDHVPGCYLVYDVESSKLVAHYSRTPVSNAIGFWRPGPNRTIQEFKFKGKNQGRHEIIGNCASATVGRKNFYSGWCQFVRAARGLNGMLTVYIRSLDQRGLDCDLFAFKRKNDSAGRGKAVRIPKSREFDISDIEAVACLPKNSAFAEYEQLAIDLNRWLTEANNLGAASRFEAF